MFGWLKDWLTARRRRPEETSVQQEKAQADQFNDWSETRQAVSDAQKEADRVLRRRRALQDELTVLRRKGTH